jgi:REP element-mobilizing transposase RayT
VENGEMILSEIGMIAKKLWQEIPDHFQFIELDEFIIMPDHIHGIIIINRNTVSNTDSDPIIVETPKLGVSTSVVSSSMAGISSESSSNTGTSAKKSIKLKNPYWKSNSIGSIINQYKRICTITIKSCGYDFQWQSRFYDRIIRSSSELIRIRKYIINNPINWKR